jgi:Mlc titration factor MtfA (ptsG expression regulator)
MFGFKRRRRQRLRETPLPPAWLRIVERHVPLYGRLAAGDRRELLGHVQVFLAEKRFEGCGGLEITDEIRLTIAAQACLLLLRRDATYYPTLLSILVYPHAYVSREEEVGPDGVVHELPAVRIGESWERGEVVLAWDEVREDAANIHDGYNVVLHEFAHQLDQEAGLADGAPVLPRRSMYADWARVLSAEYRKLQGDAARRCHTVLDPYGATHPAEFFAVATECFFEKPHDMRRMHPALYDELRRFYRQDPTAYHEAVR